MSARDDYPAAQAWMSTTTYEAMCDEIDQLRQLVAAMNAALDQLVGR